MKPTLTIVPCVSVHPDRVSFYNKVHWSPCRPGNRNPQIKDLFFHENEDLSLSGYSNKVKPIINSDRKSHGLVSFQARKKILRALDYMILLATNKTANSQISGRSVKFKLAFITLTLPSNQIHSDLVIKKECLNQFLIEIGKIYKVHNYLWRSERQENGNVHFHILIDKFIPYQEIRDRWNRIINKLGYVDRYRQEQINWHQSGFKVRTELLKTWDYQHQKEAYLRGSKNHWNSPNSTDIHSIQKIHNIRLYIIKYMAKNRIEKTEKVEGLENLKYESGRIWACSSGLSKIEGARSDVDSTIQRELEILEEVKQIKRVNDTWYVVYFINFSDLSGIKTQALFKLFCRYLSQKFNYNYQLST